MDGFPALVGTAGPPPAGIGSKALVMGYYDGNTVTALWNYAQYFALNDNNYHDAVRPVDAGALNLISGQTNGFSATMNVLNGSGTCCTRPTRRSATPPILASNSPKSATAIRSATSAPIRPSIRSPWPAGTSVTCSTTRASPGARSWAAST